MNEHSEAQYLASALLAVHGCDTKEPPSFHRSHFVVLAQNALAGVVFRRVVGGDGWMVSPHDRLTPRYIKVERHLRQIEVGNDPRDQETASALACELSRGWRGLGAVVLYTPDRVCMFHEGIMRSSWPRAACAPDKEVL